MSIKCLLGFHNTEYKGKEFWFNRGFPFEDHPYKIIIKRTCIRCGKSIDEIIKPKNREEYLKIMNSKFENSKSNK